MQQTSELVLLERVFVADETSRLEQIKQEAIAPSAAPVTTAAPSSSCEY